MKEPHRIQMTRWWKSIGPRHILFLLAGFGLLAILYLVAREAPVGKVVEAIRDLGMIPFFLAMAVLPVMGFPVTPFYLLAGATFGVPVSLAGTALAQALNLFLAYWLARRCLRGVVERIVRRAHYEIPEVAPKHYVNLTILVKITPGPPNCLKSFILALARVPFGVFFIISWPITMGFAVGVIIFGDSLVDRDAGQAVLGFLLMLVFLIGIKFAASTYTRRQGLGNPGPKEKESEG